MSSCNRALRKRLKGFVASHQVRNYSLFDSSIIVLRNQKSRKKIYVHATYILFRDTVCMYYLQNGKWLFTIELFFFIYKRIMLNVHV